jgi:initiation factor 1A
LYNNNQNRLRLNKMVKNLGGNKTKRTARKNTNMPNSGGELRMVKEEGECYAIVKKIFGNGMCDVMCQDAKVRLCIIRNKFKGKGKNQNTLEPGKWLLVGIRDWEVRSDGTQKCDVLNVYNDSEREKLIQRAAVDFAPLFMVMKEIGNSISDIGEDTGFHLADKSEIEFEELNSKSKSNGGNVVLVQDEEIDIDNI